MARDTDVLSFPTQRVSDGLVALPSLRRTRSSDLDRPSVDVPAPRRGGLALVTSLEFCRHQRSMRHSCHECSPAPFDRGPDDAA